LTTGADGTVASSWLDNRESSQQPFAAIRRPGQADFEMEQAVHTGQQGRGVCPCCPTTTLVGPDGTTYVAFRNLQDGYRDIAIGVRRPGQSSFEGPFPVVPPTWQFAGCPHDGPSLALVGDRLCVTWMDAHTGLPRCYFGSANIADLKFTVRPLNPLEEGSQGNARLCADTAGRLHVVWEENHSAASAPAHAHGEPAPTAPGQATERAIYYAFAPRADGDFGPAQAVLPKPNAVQTRPTLTVPRGGPVVVAWNELDESGKAIVVTRLTREPNRD
jgi:hypothetical protein